MSLPPTSKERSTCWKAKGAYFKCLDEHNMWLDGLTPQTETEVLTITMDTSTSSSSSASASNANSQSAAAATNGGGKTLKPSLECRNFRLLYEADCLFSWQKHFLSERLKEKQKAYLVDKIEREEKERSSTTTDFWDRVKKA